MEFRLLGPVEAVRDGRSLPLGGSKPRALLALLVLHANEVVSRDRLIEALWPDRPPGSADHSLDVQVSRLRKALEPDDAARRPGAAATSSRSSSEQIDVRRVRATARARAAGERSRQVRRTLSSARSRARALARRRARRPRLRGVRARRGRAARGAAASGDRGAHRRRARARPPRPARLRARGADLEAPPPRAATRPAHARPLPRRPAGRGAAGRTRIHVRGSSTSSGSSPGLRSRSSSRQSCAKIRGLDVRGPPSSPGAAGWQRAPPHSSLRVSPRQQPSSRLRAAPRARRRSPTQTRTPSCPRTREA